jgi:mono/diheme cytochrome c family protein
MFSTIPRRPLRHAALWAAAAAILLATAPGANADDAEIERGRYLASIMDCGGCHTRGVFLGRPDPALFLAGSEVGFHLPGLGYFYPPNLTPDPATGLGDWSEDDIVRAVRTGVRPDGRVLVPVMPYPSYAALTDQDAYALAAFLKSLPPVAYPDEPQPTGEGETPPSPYLDVVMP